MMKADVGGFVALGEDECMELLGTQVLGRVALSFRALPLVVPTTFAVVDECIVFDGHLLKLMGVGLEGTVLGFQVDGPPSSRPTWSVNVVGRGRGCSPGVLDAAFSSQPALEGGSPVSLRPEVVLGHRVFPS